MTTKMLKCPGCFEGDSLRRSHKRWRDVPFRLVGMRTYRCLTCYKRFHTWRKAAEPTEFVVRDKAA